MPNKQPQPCADAAGNLSAWPHSDTIPEGWTGQETRHDVSLVWFGDCGWCGQTLAELVRANA